MQNVSIMSDLWTIFDICNQQALVFSVKLFMPKVTALSDVWATSDTDPSQKLLITSVNIMSDLMFLSDVWAMEDIHIQMDNTVISNKYITPNYILSMSAVWPILTTPVPVNNICCIY